MGEHTPVPLRTVAQAADVNEKQQQIPPILRDKRGRIQWQLPGNTEEQNLQIGIQNIQALFLRQFPEFDVMFPRGDDEKIGEDKRNSARDFILNNLGTYNKFINAFGGSSTVRHSAPYFDGSRLVVLIKSFKPWGINIEDPSKSFDKDQAFKDRRGRIRWKLAGNTEEQNLQIVIQNIQALFLDMFPEFNQLFPRGENGQISSDREEDAKKFILDHIDAMNKPNSLLKTKTVGSYLGGNFPSALNASFRPWGIDLKLNVIDEAGKCINDFGQTLVTYTFLHKLLGCDYRTLQNELQDMPPIFGYGLNGHKIPLFNEQEARVRLARIERLKELPKPERQNEGRIIQDGKSWVTRRFIRNNYTGGHANTHMVSQLIEGTQYIKGKARNGQEEIYYLESEASSRVNNYYSLPKVDLKTGRCEYQGRRLITVGTLAVELGENQATLRSHLQKLGAYSTPGRGKGTGHNSTLFDEDEAKKLLQSEGFFERKHKNPTGHWSQTTIEEALIQFYKENGNLTTPLLLSKGRQDLLNAANKFPGLFRSVAEKLGLKLRSRRIKKENETTISREEAWRVIDMLFE